MAITLCGVLHLHKPARPTSRQVIDRVARCTKPAKVGHAGTLDPLAEGVLVVCVGPATRLIRYVQRLPKTYSAVFQFGLSSPTDDLEGAVVAVDDAPRPSRRSIDTACQKMVGQIEQRPPAFSAVKIKGQRAYALARQGQHVDVKPRPVVIHSIDVIGYEYPRLELSVTCGSGTYIRSLGRDLADLVHTSAVMSALCRTSIGDFRLDDALAFDKISAPSVPEALHPATAAVRELPQLELSEVEIKRLANGLPISRRGDAALPGIRSDDQEFAGIDQAGLLVVLLAADVDDTLRPLRNFPRAESTPDQVHRLASPNAGRSSNQPSQ